MQQVFASANMVQISPSNTNPELTQGKNWQTDKKRPYKTYFRTATTDELQGSFAADYAYNGLKKKKVFVVDDKQTYGAGLAKIFNEQFKKLGGKVAGTDHVNTGDKDFGSLVTKIKNSGADLLYYGGQYDESALITKQLKDAGVKIPLFGGDGMFASTYIEAAGTAAEGDLATAVGVPADTLPAAKTFIETYKAKGYKGDYGAYGALLLRRHHRHHQGREGRRRRQRRQGPHRHQRPALQGRRRCPEVRLRRHHRQGLLRPVRRHHQQAAHRLPGHQGRVEGCEDRHRRPRLTQAPQHNQHHHGPRGRGPRPRGPLPHPHTAR